MLTIKGIYGREMYETWYKMTVMLQSGLDIRPVITHRFSYTEFQKGFDVMLSGHCGKVVLDWENMTSMYGSFQSHLQSQLDAIREQGLYKSERVIATPQNAHVRVRSGAEVLNLCANNYLGLAQHPAVIAAAHRALDEWGYGMASVRFICGTQTIHKRLEARLSEFLGTDDTILYSSCFDANGGLFETLLGAEDAVISDELNHASIIDGVRLCKAQRFRYKNNDMADLEAKLQRGERRSLPPDRHRRRLLHGRFPRQPARDLRTGRPVPGAGHGRRFACRRLPGSARTRHSGTASGGIDRVDVLTGTLGKALGGASGGYTSGRKEIVELLRQRSRPYLFSNTLAPPIVAGSLAALDLLQASTQLRDTLEANTRFFREAMSGLGYAILPGTHPIVPIMLGEASLAARVAEAMLAQGVYVIGFSYPVVPLGKARIRTQISAAHSRADLEFAVRCFGEVRRDLGL